MVPCLSSSPCRQPAPVTAGDGKMNEIWTPPLYLMVPMLLRLLPWICPHRTFFKNALDLVAMPACIGLHMGADPVFMINNGLGGNNGLEDPHMLASLLL